MKKGHLRDVCSIMHAGLVFSGLEWKKATIPNPKNICIGLELGLILYSLFNCELFRCALINTKARKEFPKVRLLHLTNCGYILTIGVLLARVCGLWSEAWRSLHLRVLPLVLVIEIIITMVFWVLFVKDNTLIMAAHRPKKAWHQHLVHESPVHFIPFVVLLLQAGAECFPTIGSAEAIILIAFILVYWLICEIYTFCTGKYIYNVLSKFKPALRPFLFTLMMGCSILIYSGLSGFTAWVLTC